MAWNLKKRETNKYKSRQRLNIKLIFLILIKVNDIYGQQTAECPPSEAMPNCPCYNFEDALFLECAGANKDTLKRAMQAILNEGGKKLF